MNHVIESPIPLKRKSSAQHESRKRVCRLEEDRYIDPTTWDSFILADWVVGLGKSYEYCGSIFKDIGIDGETLSITSSQELAMHDIKPIHSRIILKKFDEMMNSYTMN